jgi:predicted double-glycine peptidase
VAVVTTADEQRVILADPLGGKQPMPREEFLKVWTRTVTPIEPAHRVF